MTFDSAKPLVVEIGLGCYFWLVLCTLLSGALYPALEVGTACQIPLTLSWRRGLAFGLCRIPCGGATRRARLRDAAPCGGRPHLRSNHVALLLAFTTSVAILLRTGMLFEEAAVPMIVGDVLLGASLAAAGYLWWLAFSGESPHVALLSSRASAAWGQYRLCCA
mgnify:CR=1 FL=1